MRETSRRDVDLGGLGGVALAAEVEVAEAHAEHQPAALPGAEAQAPEIEDVGTRGHVVEGRSWAGARHGPRRARTAAAPAAATRRTPSPARGRRSWPSARAACAAPTCTSSTASWHAPRLPLVPGHQIVGDGRSAAGDGADCAGAARGSGSRGWAGRAASAGTAARAARTCACGRASPGSTSTAATRRARSPTRASASPLPEAYGDLEAAPLLCAGLIGHRALRMTGDAERLGLYGFGAAAHIVCQVARHQGRRVFAFTRAGDERSQALRPVAGLRVGRRRARPGARGARRGDRLRPGRRARRRRAARAGARAARSSARAST